MVNNERMLGISKLFGVPFYEDRRWWGGYGWRVTNINGWLGQNEEKNNNGLTSHKYSDNSFSICSARDGKGYISSEQYHRVIDDHIGENINLFEVISEFSLLDSRVYVLMDSEPCFAEVHVWTNSGSNIAERVMKMAGVKMYGEIKMIDAIYGGSSIETKYIKPSSSSSLLRFSSRVNFV